MFKPIPKEIKEQILFRIKNEGVSVNQAAQDAGVSSKAIYGWLTREADKGNGNILKLNRLKRENQGLYQIIGRLTTELNKQKRGRLPR